MSFVQIDNVTKRYQEQRVLEQVSLSVEKGELVTLLGPSGCGKSTLLRCIAGLTEMEPGGRIAVGGKDITHLAPKDRGVGMVFQSYALFPNLTVFENVSFGLKMKGWSKADYVPKVKRMIQLVDLFEQEGLYPHQLSGGQQQRVALARSLVVEPSILLLDEPLSALDAKIRKSLQMELRRIQQELSITTVFVTHDQEEAMTLSDRIFIMEKGQIVQSGDPDSIYRAPANEFVARFIGNYNVLSAEEWRRLAGPSAEVRQSVALRPEVMQILPPTADASDRIGQGWVCSGTIVEHTLKGNVIRFQVEVNGVVLHVDQLNAQRQNENDLRRGAKVRLFIPEAECVVL
ncbi:ABC transporter ATP-binding protein [Brevibacillus sp. H7]|uniref:ABC transporter ATP-binding protein n=1 Tax=Brevibacillus sp. H7 TaxID=3349138 RepID=UPI003821CDF3